MKGRTALCATGNLLNNRERTYAYIHANPPTQVLADGTQTHLYCNGRIAQYDASAAEYFLADALGSVKQLADSAGGVQLSKIYEPFGEVLNDAGTDDSSYGFTGEWTDRANLPAGTLL